MWSGTTVGERGSLFVRLSWVWVHAALCAAALAGCSRASDTSDLFTTGVLPASAMPLAPLPAPHARLGNLKVALILPLSAGEEQGAAAVAMRHAAEMALAELHEPNIQLIYKDDGGTGPGALLAARQAIADGAEVILGPLFSQPVNAVKQLARQQGVPVIAFSTDVKVAAPGVYLLSSLPESDVDRVVSYAISQGKRSFVGLIPAGAYGTLVAAEFKQAVTRGGGRVLALEHYAGRDMIHEAVKKVIEASGHADAMFIPDGADVVTDMASALAAAGVKLQPIKLLGTRAWDDPKIFSDALLEGGWYPVPDLAGFRAFAARYHSRYRQDPPHRAALAYDAVTLVAGLAKTSGSHRITDEMLTNPLGFAGIDGRFRFRSDGTNQRGLTMMRVTPTGGQVIAPASPTFSVSAK